MTAKRFTVDSDGKYWDKKFNKYVTLDHLFYLVEKLEKENEQLKESVYSWSKSYNRVYEEKEQLQHKLLCKQLDKAPTEPINCKCHYEVKEMTEKRFKISKVFELNKPFPIYDGDCPLTQKEASDLLNELNEENQQLRKIEIVGEPLELFKQNKLVKRNNEKLREENKQLKRRLMIAQDKIKGLMK